MRFFKKYFLFLFIILTLSLLIGCSSNIEDEVESSEDMEFESLEDMDMEESESSPLEPEKVITTIYMSFETMEFDKAVSDLTSLIQKHKAYIENSEISYNQYRASQNYKSGFYKIRVPKDETSNFQSSLKGIGNITNESTYKEDVTKQYRDSESRLRIIEVKEERILELLEKAEKIEDIIQLENQLNETLYEKEKIQTNLIDIDDQVDFTTIEINIMEVEKLSIQTSIETGFGTRIKNAFKDSLYSFKKAIEEFILLLVYVLPFLIVIGIPAFFIVRFFVRKKEL